MSLDLSTEGLARTSAQHPWRTIGVWLVVIVAAIVLSSAWLSDSLTTEFGFTNNPDSMRADKLLEERLRGPKKANDVVTVNLISHLFPFVPVNRVLASGNSDLDQV